MHKHRPFHVLSLPRMDFNPYQELLAKHLKHHHIETTIIGKGIARFIYDLAFAKTDSIHIHFISFLFQTDKLKKRSLLFVVCACTLFLLLLKIRKMSGTRIVYTFHNNLSHERFYPRIEHFVLTKVLHYSHTIIAHFSGAQNVITNEYSVFKQKIHVIPHGSYSSYYPNTIPAHEARKKLHIDSDAFVFLFFGSLRTYKGIPDLITEFKKLALPKSRLFIVGNPANKEIQEEIERSRDNDPHIHCIYGFIPDTDIQIYMNAANILVLPYSDVFTSGTAHLALSFKKAFIAPKMNALSEFEHTALLYEIHATESLYEAMKQAPQFVEDHPTLLYEHQSWDDIAERTAKIYLQTL